MSFDYFYGPDDAEQYSFYRIPKRLITGDEFQETSTEAKLLYGLMLDRLQLSIRNQWLDSLNRVYIIYTVEDIMADLHCGNQKACKLLSELENKTGLIKRKRQGLGKPSLIYVLKFSTSCPQNDSESHFKTCENHTSGDVKTTSLDMWKSHGNNTDFNKPEYNKTNPIYPGPASAKITVSVDGMGRDEMDERRSYEKYFREHLYIDDLKQSYPYDHGRIDEIFELLVDTVCSTAKTIRCAGEDRPAEVVKSWFMKLDYGHIQYVLDCIPSSNKELYRCCLLRLCNLCPEGSMSFLSREVVLRIACM